MAFAIDDVAMLVGGYGFVVRDDRSKKLLLSICYATKDDAEEAADAMKDVLAKATSATGISGTMRL
jgi:hypothetical protein